MKRNSSIAEYGSDFHLIHLPPSQGEILSIFKIYPVARYYALGRHALFALIKKNNWKRLHIPAYFCHEVIRWIKQYANIEICLYEDAPYYDYPLIDASKLKKDDALLIVNLFGCSSIKIANNIQIPIIEDHTHDLLSNYAINSKADWCIGSLRKTLPIPDGGILWSPKGYKLPDEVNCTNNYISISKVRFNAMLLKQLYLNGQDIEKNDFRSQFLKTEKELEKIKISGLSPNTIKYLHEFDVPSFYNKKKQNYIFSLNILDNYNLKILKPKRNDSNPFSLFIELDSYEERENLRNYLSNNKIYTAWLWSLSEDVPYQIFCYSQRVLSIHIDGRYTKDDINFIIQKVKDGIVEIRGI